MSADDPTTFVREAMPLCATLDITAVEANPELVILEMPWAPERCTSNGILHGGAIMSLADGAGGTAAFLNLPEGAGGTATIESKTNFFGAVSEGVVRAAARPLHVGKRTIVIETEVHNGDRLIAKTTQTQAVL